MQRRTAGDGSVTDRMTALRELLDTLDDTLDDQDAALSRLQNACAEMQEACDALTSAMDALENAFTLLGGGPAAPDTTQLCADTAALRTAAGALEATVGRAMEELRASGSVTPETKAQLKSGLIAVLDCYAVVNRDIADVLIHTDFGALRDQNKRCGRFLRLCRVRCIPFLRRPPISAMRWESSVRR